MKSHWSTALLSTILWLFWLVPSEALRPNSLVARQPPPRKPAEDIGRFVFWGSHMAPRQVRALGGARPQGMDTLQDWGAHTEAYFLQRHVEAGACPPPVGIDGYFWRSAYVTMSRTERQVEPYAGPWGWIYEIRALPNMISGLTGSLTVYAFAGAHWRQVRRFRPNRLGSNWMWNPDYDAALYDDPESVSHYRPTAVNRDETGNFMMRNVYEYLFFELALRIDMPARSRRPGGPGDPVEVSPLIGRSRRWFIRALNIRRFFGNFPPNWTPYIDDHDLFPASHEDADAVQALEVSLAIENYISQAYALRRLLPNSQVVLEEAAASCSSRPRNPQSEHRMRRDVSYDVEKCCLLFQNITTELFDDARRRLLANRPLCSRINGLEFTFALSGDDDSGTSDKLGAVIAGSAGQAELDIVSGPSDGFSTKIAVDLKTNFGSDTMDIDAIDTINLTMSGPSRWFYENDDWKVKGISLQAKCADPGFTLTNDKYISLNAVHKLQGYKWYVPGAGHEKQVAASLSIDVEDWFMTPVCSVINQLFYHFEIGNDFWDIGPGAEGALYFKLGNGTEAFRLSNETEVFLGESLNGGYETSGEVSIWDVYGKEHVDIRDLSWLQMVDRPSREGKQDRWHFAGISFNATCAHQKGHIKLDKFAGVDEFVGQDHTNPWVYERPVRPGDWKTIDGPQSFAPSKDKEPDALSFWERVPEGDHSDVAVPGQAYPGEKNPLPIKKTIMVGHEGRTDI